MSHTLPAMELSISRRLPKGEPVYFSMICSASSSRRLICHVLSERLPARGAAQERHHKPNTLLSPAFGACSCFGMFRRIRRREPCPAPALTSQGSGGASRRSPRGSPCPAGQAPRRASLGSDRCRPPTASLPLHNLRPCPHPGTCQALPWRSYRSPCSLRSGRRWLQAVHG